MEDNPDFLRARRRYKALAREIQHLAAKKAEDEKLISEITKLEAEFPSLKDLFPHLTGEKEARSLAINTQVKPDPSKENSVSLEKRMSSEVHKYSVASGYRVGFYNAYHRRSSFGLVNLIRVIILSVLTAAMHQYLYSPRTTVGMFFSPFSCCNMVHAINLVRLTRQGERISLPKVIVYVVLDHIPSQIVSDVIYVVALSFFQLLSGARPASV
ncbi:hypothetical protein AGDE_07225 [Angomonas deanei]|nr:hypothetical protein AGDE_07225 [Angomonas deanei]|eukprot:EPY35815.1 hypothetical protein AGDE_07225 [Angomonas deanei]